MNISTWIRAARLRTLPLAISTMTVGHALAYAEGVFRWDIFWLSMITSLSLQILSNLANDYGDSVHGADSVERQGPRREVQSGGITPIAMRNASWILALVSLSFGIYLVWIAFDDWIYRGIMWALGVAAVWAAYNYTAGDKPYGYNGKGDIAVFIFFGLVTVLGAYFLQTSTIRPSHLLPAMACGALSVGVLNVNNIRDIHSDQLAGKYSIPVQIGRDAAVHYHGLLLLGSVLCLVVYNVIAGDLSWKFWIFMITAPLLIKNYLAVKYITDAQQLDPYLKQLALSGSITFLLFSLVRII